MTPIKRQKLILSTQVRGYITQFFISTAPEESSSIVEVSIDYQQTITVGSFITKLGEFV